MIDVIEPDQPISYGVLVPGPSVEDGIPFVRVQDLSVRNQPSLPSKRISPAVEQKYARTRITGGELLLGVVGSIGKVGIAPKEWRGANIARAVCRIMAHHSVDSKFLAILLQSGFMQRYFKETTRTLAQPTLNVAMIRNAPVPLPPVAEQKRIIAKVGQLMALCDELEAKQTQKQEAGARLTRAALDALTSAEGPEELAAAWQRVADNFEMLFDKPDRVEELRKAILGLALHGRLVAQTPADETTETLLSRISRDRKTNSTQSSRLAGENGAEEEERHALPASWQWTPVGNIADCVLGKMLDKSKHTKGELRPYLRNINVRWGAFDLTDLLSMYFEDDELERYGVRDGDVLICEGGEPGRSAVWRDASKEMLIQKALHRVRLRGRIAPEWLVMNLRYDSWAGRLERHFTGVTIKHFTGQALARYSIRLAPIAEQKRIIAKVDHLMTLCDELETRLRDAEAGAQRLAEAMTATMVA